MTLFEDLLALVDPALYPETGEVFYTGRSAFERPSPLYVLGLNPGGNPAALGDWTIGREVEAARSDARLDWSAYEDEPWGRYEAGEHPYQRSLRHMFERCGLAARTVPASNAIFARTVSEADLGREEKQRLLYACWPVHARLIEGLGVRVVACLGGTTGWWVRDRLGAAELVDTFVEDNARKWTSTTHENADGLRVVTLTHPSRANWINPAADPSGLVMRALRRPPKGWITEDEDYLAEEEAREAAHARFLERMSDVSGLRVYKTVEEARAAQAENEARLREARDRL
jgi:hypothetical protein